MHRGKGGIIRAGYRLQILHFYKAHVRSPSSVPPSSINVSSFFFPPSSSPMHLSTWPKWPLTTMALSRKIESQQSRTSHVPSVKRVKANAPECAQAFSSAAVPAAGPGFSNEVDGKTPGCRARKCLKNTRYQRYRRKLGSFKSILSRRIVATSEVFFFHAEKSPVISASSVLLDYSLPRSSLPPFYQQTRTC